MKYQKRPKKLRMCGFQRRKKISRIMELGTYLCSDSVTLTYLRGNIVFCHSFSLYIYRHTHSIEPSSGPAAHTWAPMFSVQCWLLTPASCQCQCREASVTVQVIGFLLYMWNNCTTFLAPSSSPSLIPAVMGT